MKKNIYNLISGANKFLFAFALTVFSGTAFAQNTYTFNYTGSQQTMLLQPGTYTIQCWGADGGMNLGNGSTTYTQNGGRGAYSVGIYTLSSPQTVYINVGGLGASSTSALNTTVAGGYNGGGYGSANSTSGKTSGAGGGGASHVGLSTGALPALLTNSTSVLIVAGAGGGAGESNYANNNSTYNSNGGNGGGMSGLQNVATGYQGRMGQGGTQTAGGGGGDNGSAIAAPPVGGVFGQGGYNPTAGSNTGIGGSGAGGGGGGWFGGGAGWVGSGTSYMAGSGGGGSGYIGGVQSGTTVGFGLTGYVANPDVSGNGRVHIIELCNFSLYAVGPTNSLTPSICSGQSATLMTNAISNYSWSTGAITSSLVVSPTSSTVYALSAMSPSNCMTARTISITVSSAPPVLSISNPSSNICLGRTVSLTASGALTYTWTNPGVVNGQTFTPLSTAQYTVTGANGCGTGSAVTGITVSALPVTASVSPTLVCQGYTAALTASSSVNGYTWMPGPIVAQNSVVSPTSATIYTITASDGTCAGTQTVLLTTKTTPTITIPQTAITMCLGEVVTITASGAGTGGTYAWTPGNATTASFTTSPPSTTLYVVSGTNSLNCTSTAQVPVIVVQPLPLNVSASSTLVCTGATVNLSANGSNSYSWTNGPGTPNYLINQTAAISVYTVTGYNTSNTCTATQTIAVAALIPNVSVTTPVNMCAGGSATVTATGANTYTWNGTNMGSTNVFVAAPAQTTTFVLIANTSSLSTNCISTRSAVVNVNPNPTVSIALTKTTTVCKGNTNTLTASGALTYTWASNNNTATAITVTANVTTNYSVTGTDANGCVNGTEAQMKVSNCSGIQEQNNFANIAVYPNPNNGQFFVKSETAVTLTLINAIGQHIKTIDLNTNNGFSVEVSGLAKGVYYLSANDGTEQTYYSKLVVN